MPPPFAPVSDAELRAHVQRLLSTPCTSLVPAPERPAFPDRPFLPHVTGLIPRDSNDALVQSLPAPLILVDGNQLIRNAALTEAFEAERELQRSERGPLKRRGPWNEEALVQIVREAVLHGAARIFVPLGKAIYEAVARSTAPGNGLIYFVPITTWHNPPAFAVRLILCMRLSGLVHKQIVTVAGLPLRSVQHASRHYRAELTDLRRRVALPEPGGEDR